MGEVCPQAAGAGLSVDELVAITGRPLRTVQRWFERWQRRGWPRVTREKVEGVDARWRLRVDAEQYRAWASGEPAPARTA